MEHYRSQKRKAEEMLMMAPLSPQDMPEEPEDFSQEQSRSETISSANEARQK